MLNVPLDSIDKARIESLIANEARESLTLEYKEKLPGGGREERKEFLADVSAFANAVGGDIFFGISEKRDDNKKTTGLPDQAIGLEGINVDAMIRQIESIITDGIEPRINGIRFKAIEGFERGPVLLLRVPRSYLAPHMIKQGDSRFYSRTNAGKYPLDVTQVRSAFARSDALPEKVRRFRDERIARIVADETPVPLPSPSRIVLHLLPAVSLDPTTQFDINPLKYKGHETSPLNSEAGNNRYNLDGFLRYVPAGDPPVPATYIQFYRNGAIEAVDTSMLVSHNPANAKKPFDPTPQEPVKLISSTFSERTLITDLKRLLNVQKSMGIDPPIFILLSLTGVRGFGVLTRWTNHEQTFVFDRDTILLPDSVAESYEDRPDSLLQPAFDAIWQASGYEMCRHYKDEQWLDDNGQPAPI